MTDTQAELHRPIRVVVFGGGPVLEWGVQQFLCRLEVHPEIDLLACLCQSEGQSLAMIIRDLWRRRRLLALPLFLLRVGKQVGRFVSQPRGRIRLRREMKRLSDRIYFVPDIHAVDVLDRVRTLTPDLGLVYGSPILRPELFEIPRLGTLGIHHGKMPEYRGKKTTFWAMYNGEATAGVTIQRINADLDAGAIVKQGEVPIGPRSLRAVCEELEDLGLDLYMQAVLEVMKGTASYQSRKAAKSKVFSDPSARDILCFCSRQLWRQLRRSI